MTNLGNKQIFAQNLSYYIERSGKSKKELAEIVGVAPSTFNEWTKGKKYPRIDKIEILASYFGILKSDLIEESTAEHKEMKEKNDDLATIVLRMRVDDDFFCTVKALHKLDKEKLNRVGALLNAFVE